MPNLPGGWGSAPLALLLPLLLASPTYADALDLELAAGGDDVEETSSGSMLLASGDLALGGSQLVGLRFSDVAIPPDQRVTGAWLQLRADESGSGAAALVIAGEAAADAAPFQRTSGDVSGRARTAATVAWAPPAWSAGQAGAAQRSPDLSAVLQEILDGAGWASGNALALSVSGSGTRVADSFEGGFGALLHVEFEPAGDRPPALSLTSPAGSAVFGLGDVVRFVAIATDREDGDLSGAVVFGSDLDGPLGVGSPLERSDLSAGIHRITATVRDRGGNETAATAQLLVTEGAARILAAGDIAGCTYTRDEATAALLDGLDGLVVTVGDNAYPSGRTQDFASCYEPGWGRHKARTRPVPGNHEYETTDAAPYFAYFGAAAGDPDEGWYSFDYGGWHVVALNSNCAEIGGCSRASPQGQWLEAELDANPSRCTLAYWHHARFSSSTDHGSSPLTRDLWAILQEHAADVVLVGHDHDYERFAPQSADGAADPLGIRQFVVGMGGAELYEMGSPEPNSEARDDTSYGVLALDLAPDGYAWRFHPAASVGGSFTDAGVAACVMRPPVLSVAAPADGSAFSPLASVAFAASASDVEEGDLSARITWTSHIDGRFGTGGAFATDDLSCGTHTVTVAVTDLFGGRDAETRTLRIGPEGCPPVGCGIGPELLALLALLLGYRVRLSASRRGGSRLPRTR
jgi:hypothetical protein